MLARICKDTPTLLLLLASPLLPSLPAYRPTYIIVWLIIKMCTTTSTAHTHPHTHTQRGLLSRAKAATSCISFGIKQLDNFAPSSPLPLFASGLWAWLHCNTLVRQTGFHPCVSPSCPLTIPFPAETPTSALTPIRIRVVLLGDFVQPISDM